MSDGQERNQKATDRHLKDVRRKGRLSRSQDLSAWVGVGAAVVMLPGVLSRGRQAGMEQLGSLQRLAAHPEPALAVTALEAGLRSAVSTLAPLLVVVVAVTLVVAAAQGGIHVRSPKPQVEQFNPVNGVKRMVGPHAWGQLAMTLGKSVAVGLALWMAIKGLLPVLIASGRLPLSQLLHEAGSGVSSLLRAGIAAGLLLGLVDVVTVIRRNRKQTRMTMRELKEENKRNEGDPQMKAAIRARQHQMSRQRMMQAVREADVVLVNPTHVAVALRYEPGKGAPRVVAKGAGAVAAKIREKATEEHVPLVEDIPLARALHAACEIGAEIPEHLFTAVARVLAFVMALRRRGASAGKHHVPGGSTLGSDDHTDHRAVARAAARAASRSRAGRPAPAADASAAPAPTSHELAVATPTTRSTTADSPARPEDGR